MKSTVTLILALFVGTITFAQKPQQPDTTRKKTQNIKVTPGASGVKRSISYKFSAILSDVDPGTGIFRCNSNNVSDITYIFVDNYDLSGEDQTDWYSTWEDLTGASGRGQINIEENEGENVIVFHITDVFVDGKGFWKIPVRYESGALPADGSVCFYVFNRIHSNSLNDVELHGNQSDQGNPSMAVNPLTEVIPAPPVTPVADVIPASLINPVAEVIPAPPVSPVAEVIPAPPVSPAAEVIPAPPVNPVTPAPQVTEVAPANPVTPEKPVKPVKKVIPDTTINPVNPIIPDKPVKPAKKIIPDTSVNPVSNGNQGDQETNETKKTEVIPVTQPAQGTQGTTVVTGSRTVPTTQPVQGTQGTTVAQGPPRVTETKPAQGNQGTTVAQGTQKAPVTQPAQGTRVNEAPVSQNDYGSTSVSHGKCYRGIIEIGYALRVSEYGMNNFRFNFINGFNIGHTSIGLGIGVRKYYDKPGNHPDWHMVSSDVQIPVFLDVRTHFSGNKVTPYLGIGIGNSVGFDSDTAENKPEGLYFHATGGIWFNLSDRFAVFGGFAYELQRLEYAKFSDEIPYKKSTNSISLNIGIAF